MAVAIRCVGKLERDKSGMRRPKPAWAFSKHLVYKRLTDEHGQKLINDDPLIVPSQLPGCLVEYAFVCCSVTPHFIDERVMGLEHRKMQLRHQHVGIVAWISDNRDALGISLH